MRENAARRDRLFNHRLISAFDMSCDRMDEYIVGAPRHTRNRGKKKAGRAYVFDAYLYQITSPAAGVTWNVGATETIACRNRVFSSSPSSSATKERSIFNTSKGSCCR